MSERYTPEAFIAPHLREASVREQFASEISENHAGGRHVVAHLDDGPFHVMVITDVADIEVLDSRASMALDYYGTRPVRFYSSDMEGYRDALLVTTSQFGVELLVNHVHITEHGEVLSYEELATYGEFDQMPNDTVVATLVPEIYFALGNDVEAVEVCTRIAATPGGLHKLLTVLNEHDKRTLQDITEDPESPDPARQLLHAIEAAVTA